MEQSAQESQPSQPQVTTTTKSTNWKKVSLTIVFIVVCVSIIAGIYWFFVLSKSSGASDLTGPVPKVTTKTATESANEATPSSEKDETADWKTYTNSQLGFTLKHPDEFPFIKEQLSTSGGQVPSVFFSGSKDFSSLDSKITTFSVSKGDFKDAYEAIEALDINKVYSRAVAEAPDVAEQTRLANVVVDGQAGIKQSYLPSSKGVRTINYTLDVLIKKNANYYEISMTSRTKDNYEKNIEIFDLIISTFKFLPS